MPGIEDSLLYQRAGLRGLQIFGRWWFPLVMLMLVGCLLPAILFLPPGLAMAASLLGICGVAVLSRMWRAFYVELRQVRD